MKLGLEMFRHLVDDVCESNLAGCLGQQDILDYPIICGSSTGAEKYSPLLVGSCYFSFARSM